MGEIMHLRQIAPQNLTLEQAEEEFGCELYDFLLKIQEGKEGFGEV